MKPAAAPAPSKPTSERWQKQHLHARVVAVSGLKAGGGSGKKMVVLALVAVIGAAAWFVLSRM